MLDDLLKKLKNFDPKSFISKLKKKKGDEDEEFEDELDDDFDEDEEDDFEENTEKIERPDDKEVEEEAESEEADEDIEEDQNEDEEEEEEDEEIDEEELKKQKKSKIIKIVAGVAVAFFVLDEFVLKEDKPVQPTQPSVSKKGPKKERKNKKVTKKVDSKQAPKPAEKPQNEPTPKVDEPKVEAIKAEEPKIETANQPVEEVVPTAPVEEAKDSGEVRERKDSTITVEVENQLNLGEEKEEVIPEAAPQIEEVAEDTQEYVSPPEYNEFGRGLVYNCKGKHWACVNKESYLKCKKNENHFSKLNQGPECHTKNVYSSENDCRVVQVHYINTNEKTDFCK